MAGHASRQNELGYYFERGKPPVRKDLIAALMWFELANEAGHEQAENAVQRLAAQLPEPDVTAAREMARNWEPDTNICEYSR